MDVSTLSATSRTSAVYWSLLELLEVSERNSIWPLRVSLPIQIFSKSRSEFLVLTALERERSRTTINLYAVKFQGCLLQPVKKMSYTQSARGAFQTFCAQNGMLYTLYGLKPMLVSVSFEIYYLRQQGKTLVALEENDEEGTSLWTMTIAAREWFKTPVTFDTTNMTQACSPSGKVFVYGKNIITQDWSFWRMCDLYEELSDDAPQYQKYLATLRQNAAIPNAALVSVSLDRGMSSDQINCHADVPEEPEILELTTSATTMMRANSMITPLCFQWITSHNSMDKYPDQERDQEFSQQHNSGPYKGGYCSYNRAPHTYHS
ncbi:unnamed protein product [Caenorhabditis nigoni]